MHLKTCSQFKALAFKNILAQGLLDFIFSRFRSWLLTVGGACTAVFLLDSMGSGASLHVPEEVLQLIPEPPAKEARQGRNLPRKACFFLEDPRSIQAGKKLPCKF